MSDEVPPPSRFLVRKGCKGWMVYDRQRKGPAMAGTDPAVNLAALTPAVLSTRLVSLSSCSRGIPPARALAVNPSRLSARLFC